MKRVGAGFCHHRNLRTRRTPEFRREGRSLDPEFLQRIQRNQIAEAAKGVGCWKLAGAALPKTGNRRSQVRAYPIHGEIIRVGPLAVHTELAFFKEIVWHQHDSRRQVDKSAEAAPIQRHVLNESVVNERAHGCI